MAPARSLRHPDLALRVMVSAALAAMLGCAPPAAGAAAPRLTGEQAYRHGDYVRAAQLLLPEALAGRATAQAYLGFMYEYGLGVPRDFAAAAKWLTLAADQGVPTAQFLLGGLYDRGLGVSHDPVRAEIWYNLAAAHADPGNREFWQGMRDAVASKLSQAELAEAQRRARDWVPPAQP
ncbi:MAG: sel1 repeat family protein [Hyphomicrobiales bacterium]|nr:sel1 repeat family protein [Hyphomicrobiales bacterium]MBV8664031.1 sel1 repeat family protein [Hyphomicrobiales bacterium]